MLLPKLYDLIGSNEANEANRSDHQPHCLLSSVGHGANSNALQNRYFSMAHSIWSNK